MAILPDPADVIRRMSRGRWSGIVWRCHWKGSLPTDASKSLGGAGGRFNVGRDSTAFKSTDAFPALYTSRESATAVLETLRHLMDREARSSLTRTDVLEIFDGFRHRVLTELAVDLKDVLDCSQPARIGLDERALVDDATYLYTQSLALASMRSGADGLLVPSATGVGLNLIIFPSVRLPSILVMRRFADLSAVIRKYP